MRTDEHLVATALCMALNERKYAAILTADHDLVRILKDSVTVLTLGMPEGPSTLACASPVRIYLCKGDKHYVAVDSVEYSRRVATGNDINPRILGLLGELLDPQQPPLRILDA